MSKPGLATRIAASIILTRVIDDQRSLDGLLDTRHGPSQFRNLDDPDKSLARAIVTSALRHRGEIEYALNKLLDRKLPKNARQLIHTLHTAAAQILFLDVPDSAAVDLAVTALRQDKRSIRFAGLANAILRRLSREKAGLLADKSETDIALLNVAPWLKKRIRKDYGKERLAAIATQHMMEPVIDLTVRADPEEWADTLQGTHLFGNSVRVQRPGKVESWPGFEQGHWWIQDAAASLPVHLFGDLAGKSALDLCAAPGGKTAQLATGGAQVTALEASQPRLDRLRNNLRRLGLEANCILTDMMQWQGDQLYDLVLLDAPCSSTGTIRRHPDVQWSKSAGAVEELAQLQFDMILQAVQFIKPGGTLVFSNCSLDRAEGEDVYAKVLAACPQLQPNPVEPSQVFNMPELINRQGTVRTLPCHLTGSDTQPIDPIMSGLDGFFCARFTRVA